MDVKQDTLSAASCRCGAVVLEVKGTPIVHAACYCASCQEAGRQLESLPGAPPVLDADGGTDVVVYRKDAPNYAARSGRFMWKLLAAWVSMRFRTPKVEGIRA